jgi:two-component system chemotaxis sensor kinase CheA
MGIAEQHLALLVDDVLTEQELAVKPLGYPLKRVRNVTGAPLLGNGQPVVVLNPGDLVKSLPRAKNPVIPATADSESDPEIRVCILVVDDSITTRTLEKNILEASGFEVVTAIDGVEALKRLEEEPIDVVVSDIQMPNMDGFALTQHLRESDKYGELPIILVTSLESREDRERGMLAGADAYIVKRGFDQAELLTTIRQHL